MRTFSSFDAISKHADAWELDDIVERRARQAGLEFVPYWNEEQTIDGELYPSGNPSGSGVIRGFTQSYGEY